MLQKTYITLLFLLVASSAFAQKTERDYLRSGNKLYNDSLFIKAEVDYRKALEINPKSTDAMFNLGNSLLMQQKAKEAMEQFESASKVEKDKVNWHRFIITWELSFSRPSSIHSV